MLESIVATVHTFGMLLLLYPEARNGARVRRNVRKLFNTCHFLYTRRQIDHRYVRGTGRICYRDVISDLTERFVLWYMIQLVCVGEIFSLYRRACIYYLGVARPSCIHTCTYNYKWPIRDAYGRAGYKLYKIMLSSSDSMEVRGKCICRCYLY